MRTKFFTILTLSTLTVLTAAITGCSKNNGNGSSAGFSATVGTTGFSPSVSEAFYSSLLSTYEIGGFSIKSGDTTSLVVSLPAPFKLNTALNTDAVPGLEVEYFDTKGMDYAAEGNWAFATVTVTSLDSVGHKISGTFSGTLWNTNTSSNDSLKITNGKFSTSYTVQ